MKQETKRLLQIGGMLFALYLAIYYWSTVAGIGTKILGAAKPLIIGCVIAYIVNILVSYYEAKLLKKLKKRKRLVSIVLAFASILLILYLIINLIVPELVSCIKTLVQEIPRWLESADVERKLEAALVELGLDMNISDTIMQGIQSFYVQISSAFGTIVSMLTSVTSMMISVFIGVIFAIYLVTGKEKISSQFLRIGRSNLNQKWLDKILHVLHVLNNCFHKYIVGQTTEAVILGCLCTIGMLILQLPYAAMIGTFVGFTALIPVAGAYMGSAVGVIMIFTVSPIKSLVFLIFVLLLQQVENNLIYPKVVGASIGLPGMWVLAAITVGGGIFGIPGMLIGVPITSALYQMLKEDTEKKENRQAQEPEEGVEETEKKTEKKTEPTEKEAGQTGKEESEKNRRTDRRKDRRTDKSR